MLSWLKTHLEVLHLSLGSSLPFFAFALFQLGALTLWRFPPSPAVGLYFFWLIGIPWYAWVIGWLLILWVLTLNYSVQRKKRFDETSLNFFRSYLDFLINQGHQLFHRSEDKDFYSKINEWRHQAIEGIAIGLGPVESQKFFQKMETQNPLSQAYRESTTARSGEPLARWLQKQLEELGQIRLSLPEREEKEGKELAVSGKNEPGPPPPAKVELLTGETGTPTAKRLPPK
jgi:hypothetical protein